jgi:hypothetical protein
MNCAWPISPQAGTPPGRGPARLAMLVLLTTPQGRPAPRKGPAKSLLPDRRQAFPCLRSCVPRLVVILGSFVMSFAGRLGAPLAAHLRSLGGHSLAPSRIRWFSGVRHMAAPAIGLRQSGISPKPEAPGNANCRHGCANAAAAACQQSSRPCAAGSICEGLRPPRLAGLRSPLM